MKSLTGNGVQTRVSPERPPKLDELLLAPPSEAGAGMKQNRKME